MLIDVLCQFVAVQGRPPSFSFCFNEQYSWESQQHSEKKRLLQAFYTDCQYRLF